jgi:hypothetical protein
MLPNSALAPLNGWFKNMNAYSILSTFNKCYPLLCIFVDIAVAVNAKFGCI